MELTATQAIWIRRTPLLFVLFVVFILPIIMLVWYKQWDTLTPILSIYAVVGLAWSLVYGVEWYGHSNKLSLKQKAIRQQQVEDADEWNLIYKKYCQDIGQPNRPQPEPTTHQQQRDKDEAWKHRYGGYA